MQTSNVDVTEVRRVTWAEYPNRFMLTKLVAEIKHHKSKPTIMYVLGRLSPKRVDLNKHEYDRYFIATIGIYAVFHNVVVPLEKFISSKREDFVASINFVMDNKLFAPNTQDEVEAEWTLERAR